jgi:hypothetical protein
MTRLEELIKDLPPDLQQEVEDFVQLLIMKKARKPSGTLILNWRGAMKEFHDKYTAVDLQHKALEWWGD